jgi:acyl-CoA synthetase (AMP-forming)/AMP-acid ligase II/acyl carrier protein
LKVSQKLQERRAGKKPACRVFSHLGDLVGHYARMAPRRNAILAPGQLPVTYGRLAARVKDTVSELRSLGIARAERVAVVLPTGPEAAVTVIAVASAAVCVPLNPGFTADEALRYFADLHLAALLTRADMNSSCRKVAHTLGIPVIDLSPRPSEGAAAFALTGSGTPGNADGLKARSANDHAFILFTSGTTSRPKIVPLTHASVCLSAYNAAAVLRLETQDRLLNVLPLFHAHGLISGLLTALAAGSSAVCTSAFDPAAFFGWLTEFRPTWYTAVPAIHQAVLSVADRYRGGLRRCSLRVIRSASAPLPPDVLHELQSLFGVPVIETYGMTEAASQIAANPLRRRKHGSVGQAAGAEIAITDREGRPLAAHQPGEITLRGPTITAGYENDAAATRSAFRNGWFLTGDLGYLDEDGYLFIVGRMKDVIKRGGQQVAPAEVEAALLKHSDVIEAAVFSVPHERFGEDVAAAVVLRPDAKVSAQKLRACARQHLARFKVPGLIEIVSALPKTAGGKIKRGELSALARGPQRSPAEGGVDLVPPRSELQRQLVEMWTKLLDVNQIGIADDIFALGADSITVTQMLSSLRARFGVDLSFEDILDAPTVQTLADRVQSWDRNSATAYVGLHDERIESARPEGLGPCLVSILQEHLLTIERQLPGLPRFNLPFAYRLQGPLNVAALERSLTEVVRRHQSLRTAFDWNDGVPVARTASSAAIGSSVAVEDLAAGLPDGDIRTKRLLLKQAELEAELASLVPFDLNQAPLFRTHLFRLGPDDHLLILILHHIITDGWSMGVLIDEVSQFYSALAGGRQPQLPEPALQFSDFARWQRRWCASRTGDRQFALWKTRLREASPVFPANGQLGGARLAERGTREPFHVPNDLTARLTALSHSQGATLFMTLLACLKALLLARSGRTDICVATAMANRSRAGTERVIGPLENTILIRSRLDPDLSFHEALGRVRKSVLQAYAGQELPFEILGPRLAQEDGVAPASLIQVFFLLQNAFRPLKLPGLAAHPLAYPEGQPAMPMDRTCLNMVVQGTPSGLAGVCSCKHDQFAPNAAQNWIADYKTILGKAAANPETSLGRLAED